MLYEVGVSEIDYRLKFEKKISYKEVFMINLKTSFCSRAIYEVKAILSLHTRPGQNFELKLEPKVFFLFLFLEKSVKKRN